MRAIAPTLVLCLLAFSCSQDSPSRLHGAGSEVQGLTPGQLHNELLARFHADSGAALDAEARVDVALRVSNEILSAYGEPAVTREQVIAWQELGRTLMREAMKEGPLAIADRLLESEESRLWWRRFSARPLTDVAKEALRPEVHPVQLGTRCPLATLEPVSRLAVADMPEDPLLQEFVDIAVHSADYWSRRHQISATADSSEVSSEQRLTLGQKLFRHYCIATVDGVAGALVGVASGPAGAVTGPIAGYLASEAGNWLAGW